MTRSDIIDAIAKVLAGPMQHRHMEAFSPTARLNQDLYLDSVLILQIFLNLELEHGLMVDDAVISRKDVVTVADLADLFLPEDDAAPSEPEPAAEPMAEFEGGVHGEDYYDIKVHCFVSCLCDGLKRRDIDHRPFYFGIWDAPFGISPRHELLYHDATVSHEPFRLWFERLYRAPVTPWYDHSRSKDENIAAFLDLLEKRKETEGVMVMLDLFHLPERENKFNQNPFPHYLMPEMTEDPDVWFIRDPDYRWEGPIERAKVLNAIAAVRRWRLSFRPCRLPAGCRCRCLGLSERLPDPRPQPADRRAAIDPCRPCRRARRADASRPDIRASRTAGARHPQICL